MSGGGSPRSGFLPSRVVHLHATRFCNLACQHCYSDSGPNVRGELDPEPLIAALENLRAEGYEVLSLSGGEPLLYSGFKTITCAAVEAGFQVNLITNGAAVGGKLLEYIGKYVSLVAVSLDGRPEVHNELRGDANAFARAERALDRLSGKDVQFGIAYCVSRESLADMPWAVEFAAEKGAGLVQFHPFAATGRGRLFAQRLNLSESEKARAYVIAALLETDEDPKIQLDLVPVAAAGARRDDYAALSADDADSLLLSDLVNPLIIDDAGVLLPLCYGINQRLAVGNIGPNLPTSIAEFKEHGRYSLRALIDTAFDRLGMHGERYTDWFYHLVVTSQLESSTHPLAVLSES